MSSVRLMDRTDIKYVTDIKTLGCILRQIVDGYYIQEKDGQREFPYRTVYFDTEDHRMYSEHERGKRRRQKIRIREYVGTGTGYLEVKNKNNKGKTKKIRIKYTPEDRDRNTKFIERNTPYQIEELNRSLENSFTRITLVNKDKTERVTIDRKLESHNPRTGRTVMLEGLAVIEVKKEGRAPSAISGTLKELRVKPAKFSKYCIGLALTDNGLRQNRFKERIRSLTKICKTRYI